MCHESPGQDHSELLITLLFPAGPWKLTRELAVPGKAPPIAPHSINSASVQNRKKVKHFESPFPRWSWLIDLLFA